MATQQAAQQQHSPEPDVDFLIMLLDEMERLLLEQERIARARERIASEAQGQGVPA